MRASSSSRRTGTPPGPPWRSPRRRASPAPASPAARAAPPARLAMTLLRRALETARATPAIVLILIAIVSVQGGASLASVLVRDHGPITIVAIRLLVSAAVLWAFRRPSGTGTSPGAVRR